MQKEKGKNQLSMSLLTQKNLRNNRLIHTKKMQDEKQDQQIKDEYKPRFTR